jgi:ubiquitin-protein ligase
MAQSARDRRLAEDYKELRALFDADAHVEIVALGRVPSDRYRIVYKVPSLRLNSAGKPIQVDATVIELQLPTGYPKLPPVAKTIAGDVVFHPNFNSSKICLMDHWAPATQLTDLVREIGEMLQWQKYNIRSPLNADAAEWSQSHQGELPLSTISIGSTTKIRLRK